MAVAKDFIQTRQPCTGTVSDGPQFQQRHITPISSGKPTSCEAGQQTTISFSRDRPFYCTIIVFTANAIVVKRSMPSANIIYLVACYRRLLYVPCVTKWKKSSSQQSIVWTVILSNRVCLLYAVYVISC